MKKLIILLLLIAGSTFASDWITTNSNHHFVMIKYVDDQGIITNHVFSEDSQVEYDKHWTVYGVRNTSPAEYSLNWHSPDQIVKPDTNVLNAINWEDGKELVDAANYAPGSRDVRDTAASNIVVLSSTYGITNQPISWAAVAAAMQIERTDATASNDIMRLLQVIGDGTEMLSYKEFYIENGGDVFNVTWP